MTSTKEEKPSGQGDGGSAGGTSPTKSQKGTGQKVSNERGAHTHSKKNPGKRPHKGGS
jgi:hypothetical protein